MVTDANLDLLRQIAHFIAGRQQRARGNDHHAAIQEAKLGVTLGGTALLVKADLHREGLIFPAYSHRGYIETEGLAMMAHDMGYQCWAMPAVRIVHAKR